MLRKIAGGLRPLFLKERVERELDEELRDFLEMAIQEKMREGVSREDALRAVRWERGSLEGAKETVRAAGWESFVETCCQDLRFVLRMLRKSPGFTTVAVVTLALGMGANTAIFTLVEVVMLKSLPVMNPTQLYRLGRQQQLLRDVGHPKRRQLCSLLLSAVRVSPRPHAGI